MCMVVIIAVNRLMWPAADWLKLQIADSVNVACVVVETENMQTVCSL